MKIWVNLMILALVLVPLNHVQAAGPVTGVVVLNSDQVHSAVDIESAFHQATGWGEHPGMVILDGSRGPFVYDPGTADVDINIFYSDLTLRGVNGAVVHGGGMNFDGMPLQRVVIEDLEMHCPADCITSPDGMHRDITIRRNRLQAEMTGILVGWTDGWRIQDNIIRAGGAAVSLDHTAEIDLLHNELRGDHPVELNQAGGCRVTNNDLYSVTVGVVLKDGSDGNQVTGNTIAGVQTAGIALEAGAQDNQVHGNMVLCAVWTECQAVMADVPTWAANNISGNLIK